MRRSPGDEWIEIELLPVDDGHEPGVSIARPDMEDSGRRPGEPPMTGIGRLRRPPIGWTNRPLIRRPVPTGSVSSVRRLVSREFVRSAATLAHAMGDAMGRAGDGSQAARPSPLVRGRAGSLIVVGPGSTTPRRLEIHVPAVLHVRHSWLVVPVDLVLGAWSATWSELRLDQRGRNSRRHLPRRYFDAAHQVMDALRGQIERAES